MLIPQEIIRRKRNSETLSQQEIEYFVNGLTHGEFLDSQVSALAMAIYFNGLQTEELVHLTKHMLNSGRVLKWENLDGPVVDKHSTGGIGDKVSLLLAPILAACDVYVPMIAGRGLGFTGGTIDKLESIPGYQVQPGFDKFSKIVKEVGCSIIGQTDDLAPADRRFYSIRDVTATVESIELITASILSKKMAAGLDTLVMDVKYGNGAFAHDYDMALELAKSLVNVANGCGLKTTALITDMNQVLGKNFGNAVEVREVIEAYKTGDFEERLKEVTFSLCAEVLYTSNACSSPEEARQKVEDVWASGKPVEYFSRMVYEHGGPVDFIEKADDYLAKANHIQPIYPKHPGYVTQMDARFLGLTVVELGGGRLNNSNPVDHRVGFTYMAAIGDYVDQDTPLGFAHANSEKSLQKAIDSVLKYYEISEESPNDVLPVVAKRYA